MSYRKPKRICCGLPQEDMDRLLAILKPIRSRREVAVLLGISRTLVLQLEKSALSNIVRALKDSENNVEQEG